jgi:hypothetical protein
MEQARAAHGRRMRVGWLILFVVLLLVVVVHISTRSVVRYETPLRQKAQLASIGDALELFDNQFGGYPPSGANDVAGSPYCGAMKLAEAMVGQDWLGFHRKSAFRVNGLDPNSLASLYTTKTVPERVGPFLPLENANVYKLIDVYGKAKTGPFPEDLPVLCDIYSRERPSGRKIGMPILYYRANRSSTVHDLDNPDNPENIYDYRDNLALINLGVPGDPNAVHPLANPRRFYLNTQSARTGEPTPYRRDSYLLIRAGWDGLYGTADDICNFEWTYHER